MGGGGGGARTSLWLTKSRKEKLLRITVSSAVLSQQKTIQTSPAWMETHNTEMYFFKFMPKLNQAKFKLLVRTVLHPRS